MPDHIRTDAESAEDRDSALEQWTRSQPGLAGAELRPASGDASFRRYFRVRSRSRSLIVMDAPPPMEDCRPFVRIAGWLRAMSLNAPEILAADLDRGFLLMTDLGDCTYLEAILREPDSIDALYRDAVDALLRMQAGGAAFQARLPPYDEALLRREMALFHDWLCGRYLQLSFGRREESSWEKLCGLLVDNALAQPRVFVHRDYHSRNLMRTETGNPGILDFQDAVEGPLTYDLVSLLRDCYFRLGDERIRQLAEGYYDGLDRSVLGRMDRATFWRRFDLSGVQRHLKAAGIFVRLSLRDGKDGYLADVPRTLGYIVDVADRHGELADLSRTIRDRCLPALETGS